MRKSLTILLVAMFVLAGGRIASADPITINQGITAEYSYVVDLSDNNDVAPEDKHVWPDYTGYAWITLSEDGTQLIIVLKNTSTATTYPGKIGAFGFDSDPNVLTNPELSLGFATFTFSVYCTSTDGDCSGNNKILQMEVVGTSDKGDATNTLAQGEKGKAVFTLSPAYTNITLLDTRIHMRGIGPRDYSDKPSGHFEHFTPEPASMFLLGTGMLSAGAFLRRRSKR